MEGPKMSVKNHKFEADTGKILDIVINSLYSQKEIFIRELISNASDALDKRRYLSSTDANVSSTDASKIIISSNKKDKTLTISDNGVGLDEEEMIEALGTIARSGTKDFIEKLNSSKDKEGSKIALIGKFGVGFYSAFMVSENVTVTSRKAGTDDAFEWKSDGHTGYDISRSKKDTAGTSITLNLKKEDKEFLDEVRISHLVKKYSDHISYPIEWLESDTVSRVLNSATAIWTKSPKEIKEEDYKSFYNQIGGSFDEPFMTLHNKTEGVIDFTQLLFIPSSPPLDLFDPERKSKLKLYINRVFITDDCDDLVPKWLRFIKGIVDTPDVDLNVSREMLQKNPAVAKIRKSIIRKVLSELKKKLEKNKEEFDKFWLNFGRVIKEGMYEDSENRGKIVEICRFHSSRENSHLSLQDYINGMLEGQDQIYYLSAETLAKAETSPHLEGFKSKGLDVLLLTDPIDEFWIPIMSEYNGKKFTSISRGGADLDKFGSIDKKEKKEVDAGKFEKLIEKIGHHLEGKISKVRLSKTLTSSPSCLVADEDGMDIQMEKMMMSHNPEFKGSPRILEINPNHRLIKSLNSIIKKGDSSIAEDVSMLLFDQAQILEGKTPEELITFSQRLTRVMQSCLTSKV
tara:strand:- start:1705 stop:3591 length:1887 start_codon:yes stop_codon:yes gene_type:complete